MWRDLNLLLLYCPYCNCVASFNKDYRKLMQSYYLNARQLVNIWCACDDVQEWGVIHYFYYIGRGDSNDYQPEQGLYVRTLPKRVKDIEFIKRRWIYLGKDNP